ncbi:sushi, von Willebrand factor type A, EGF and pentraxin domain-containing protein 1-like isoform X2 [Rhopilema esculentum]|uniref:sushi, von Willebrand factor type A, EGF and pentraxin domain-containing protein 1-like isoform X2 n=1 Tax=Rhopilema esculentum TaxID=499914 RepID=UPI0031CDC99A
MRRVSAYACAFDKKYPPGDVKFHLRQETIPEVSIQYLIPVSLRPINKSLSEFTCSLDALKMKNKNWLILLVLVIITSIIVVLTNGAATDCPKRTEQNHRCRKSCSSDEDCKTKSKKRKKQCICDGPCGLSCIKTNQKCRVDPSLVTSLKQGNVFLNSRPYKDSIFKVGDVVSYKCNNRFTLVGPSQVTCSGIGKWKPWDKGRTECVRRCKDPGNLKDGRIVSRSFDIGQTVRFRCNPGYILKGSTSAKCKRDMTWSEPLPKCEVKTCDQPNLPENSHIYRGKEVAYQYGDRIFLRCTDGYNRLGSSILYCHSTGWRSYGTTTMKCAPKSCGMPGSVRNGRIEGTLFTYKNTVEYKCNHGYFLRGQSTRHCLANQKWSGSTPICERVDCGDPGPLPNGKYEKYGTKFNDKHYVGCNTGYVISGPTEMTCLGSGKWSQKPRCSRVTCDSGHVTIANGKVTGDDAGTSCTNTYNCKLTYTCDNGYDLYSTGHPICQINGQWSKQKSRCEPKNCGDPRPIVGGRLVSGRFVYPNVIKYECYDNYDMDGPDELKCQADGTWDRRPRCIANCGDPGLPKNGNRTFNGFKSGNSILFQCDSGYRLYGAESITCLQNSARWSARIPYCLPKNCGRPDGVRNGRIEGTIFTYKNTVEYKCNHGYFLRGQSTRHCLANQKWSGSTPICERVDCGDPGPVPNGLYENFEQKFNDKRSVKCYPKFAMQGFGEITCQGSGKWSKKPTCKFVTCDAGHLNIENGKVTGDDAGTSCTNTYNCKLTYTCDNGYDLIDDGQPICQENGQWSKRKSRCEPKTCVDPRPINGGRLVSGGFLFPSSVKYECLEGYTMVGPDELKCQADGTWNREPNCIGIKCGKPPELKNGYQVSLQQEYSFSDVVVYKCNDGFQTSSRLETTCQANGQWSNFTASCKAITCSEPNIANSENDRDSAPYAVGTRLKVECKAGFKLNGEPTITCNANGVWDSYPKCESAITCSEPNIANSENDRDSAPYAVGTRLKVECKAGFKLNGEPTITCNANGVWDSYPKCESAMTCSEPNIANSENDRDSAPYAVGTRLKVECKAGFKLNGEPTITCNANGVWDSYPKCESAITCSEPNIANSQSDRDSAPYAVGTRLKVECKAGFKLNGEPTITCNANGIWDSYPKCESARTCSEPNIANSEKDRDSAPYAVGTRLKVECKAGFKLNGEPTITCNANGVWDSYPKCESATQNSCESPLGMENGDIRDNQIEVQHLYGRGYSKTARRNERKTWCGSYYKNSLAVIIRLDKVVRITAVLFQLKWPAFGGALASFRYFDANDKDDIFKETKRYSLLKRTNKEITVKLEEQIETSHFEIVLHSQVSHTVCERFEIFGCNVDSHCQRPSAPKNGEAIGMVYREGDKAIFSCKHGYKLSGQDHPVCDANGSWEGFTPSCIADDKQVGCYQEIENFKKQPSNQFSLDTCRASCQKASFSYAISQFSGQCFCGNVIDVKASIEKNCYVPCKADISRKCGSPFAESVYFAS